MVKLWVFYFWRKLERHKAEFYCLYSSGKWKETLVGRAEEGIGNWGTESGKTDQWDINIFSGKGTNLIFGFMFSNFILQCIPLKRVGWEGRTSHKQICRFLFQRDFFPALQWKNIKTFKELVFLILLSEFLLILNQRDSKTKRLKCFPSAKDMQVLFSSLGLCWCVSCSKQTAHLLSQIPSLQTFNQNFIFLGKFCLSKLHFLSPFSKKSLPNISRAAVQKRIWKSHRSVHDFAFLPRRKGRRKPKLKRLYGSTRLDPLGCGVFLYPSMPTFLVHHLVFQEQNSHFYAVPVNSIKFWSLTVIGRQMFVFKLIYYQRLFKLFLLF